MTGGEFLVPEGTNVDLPPPENYRAVGSVTGFDWSANDDGTNTRLVINMEDDAERAERLASELRCCGMVVSISDRDPLDEYQQWPEDDQQ